MNDQIIVEIAMAVIGSGGIAEALRRFRKMRPPKGEAIITLAQGAVVAQGDALKDVERERDYWKAETLRERKDNAKLRREIERLEREMGDLTARLEHVQADLSALRRGLPRKP